MLEYDRMGGKKSTLFLSFLIFFSTSFHFHSLINKKKGVTDSIGNLTCKKKKDVPE